MDRPNPLRVVVAGLVLVAGLGTLVGCGSNDTTGVTATDGTSASSPGAPSGTVSTVPSASADVTPAEGLPAGFPTDDVPLLDEPVLTGSQGGPDGEFAWSVVQQTSRAVSDVSAQVRKNFTAAGYTAAPGNELGDLSVMRFKGPRYDVGVTAARTEGHVVITYVVRDVG